MQIFLTFGEKARVYWSKSEHEVRQFTANGASITGDVIALNISDEIFERLGEPLNEVPNTQCIF